MRIFDGVLIVGSVYALACFAEIALRVDSGQNIMDGTEWARMSITSSAAITPPAVLQIECTQKKKRHSFGIYLVSGSLESHPQVGLAFPVSEWLLRMKLDDAKSVWRSWRPTEHAGTYEYEGQGASGMGGLYPPKKFLKDLLAAKTVYIEFQRYGERGVYVSRFDTSLLKAAFDARHECAAN